MEVPINYLAVLVCGVVSMVLGFLWYGPLFGKQWMKFNGISTADAERFRADPSSKRMMNTNYAVQIVGSLVMAYVLAHSLVFASTYLQISGLNAGLQAGFWSWLGFVAPVTLGSVLWDRKPLMLWVINSSYVLVQLLLMGVILALWV